MNVLFGGSKLAKKAKDLPRQTGTHVLRVDCDFKKFVFIGATVVRAVVDLSFITNLFTLGELEGGDPDSVPVGNADIGYF